MIPKTINLKHQWQMYLKRVGLKEHELSEVQRIETKRAFYGACGQILILLRDEVSLLRDDEAVFCMQNMLDQIQDFWQIEIASQN